MSPGYSKCIEDKDRKQQKHQVTVSVCKLSYWSPPYVDGKMVADTHLLVGYGMNFV